MFPSASKDVALAEAIVRAVIAIDRTLTVYAPGASQIAQAARSAGLAVAAEAFADRAYEADGTLVPRTKPGAVIEDPGEVAARAFRMVAEGVVTAADGSELRIAVDTICVHGDTPGAAALAKQLRGHLEAAGVRVQAPGT